MKIQVRAVPRDPKAGGWPAGEPQQPRRLRRCRAHQCPRLHRLHRFTLQDRRAHRHARPQNHGGVRQDHQVVGLPRRVLVSVADGRCAAANAGSEVRERARLHYRPADQPGLREGAARGHSWPTAEPVFHAHRGLGEGTEVWVHIQCAKAKYVFKNSLFNSVIWKFPPGEQHARSDWWDVAKFLHSTDPFLRRNLHPLPAATKSLSWRALGRAETPGSRPALRGVPHQRVEQSVPVLPGEQRRCSADGGGARHVCGGNQPEGGWQNWFVLVKIHLRTKKTVMV